LFCPRKAPTGFLAHNACSSASRTKFVRAEEDARQPTILRASTAAMEIEALFVKPI